MRVVLLDERLEGEAHERLVAPLRGRDRGEPERASPGHGETRRIAREKDAPVEREAAIRVARDALHEAIGREVEEVVFERLPRVGRDRREGLLVEARDEPE